MSRRRRGRRAPAELAQPIAQPVTAAAPAVELEVTIDTSSLKMKDLTLLARLRKGEGGDIEALAFLNRVVVGGVDELPLDAMPQIWVAVNQAVYGRGTRAKN